MENKVEGPYEVQIDDDGNSQLNVGDITIYLGQDWAIESVLDKVSRFYGHPDLVGVVGDRVVMVYSNDLEGGINVVVLSDEEVEAGFRPISNSIHMERE